MKPQQIEVGVHGRPNVLRRWLPVFGVASVASLLLFLLLYQADVSDLRWSARDELLDPRLQGLTFVDSAAFNCSALGLIGQPGRQVEERFHYHRFVGGGKKEAAAGGTSYASCQSKYQQHCFREKTGEPPAKFMEAVREYEAYHERCTKGQNLTEMGVRGDVPEDSECKYLVWKSMDGMGNQLLSLVCAFVYAILTKRAMLIATDSHIDSLLCEPFQNSSWLLPDDFPEPDLRSRAKRVVSYLDETRAAANSNPSFCSDPSALRGGSDNNVPKHLYVYIVCCDERRDHQFFCPTAQKLFSNVNWIFYHSHEYTLPAFYFVPDFRDQLHDWFPSHDVFMHVSRYLLNPVDHIWADITRIYKAELDGAKKRIAFQPRAWRADYNPSISRQIQRCAMEQKLLPKPLEDQQRTPPVLNQSSEGLGLGGERPQAVVDVSVLVTSLRAEYANDLKATYTVHPNEENLEVRVWTASNEGWQKTGDTAHDEKAIVDIWLLSFMQELVITPFSTFGSTASGLAGMAPLLFNWYGQDRLSEPACGRTNVVGPCFLVYPRNQPCDLDPARASIFDPAEKVPEVKLCAFNPGLGIEVAH